jgi:hypothetical protein
MWNGAVAVAVFVTIPLTSEVKVTWLLACEVSVTVTTIVVLAFVNVETVTETVEKKGCSV